MKNKNEKLFQKYLAGMADADEKKALNDWITSNSDLKQWMEEEMSGMPQTINTARQTELLHNIHSKIKKQPTLKKQLIGRVKTAAAIALILLSVGAGVWALRDNSRIARQHTVVEAMRGQKTTVTLPDGTKVTLNSDTKLSYNNGYNLKSRAVALTGEAFFHVPQNHRLPFTVNAGGVEVRATGTAFNVRAYENESLITATLVEGGVNIKTPQQTIRLTPDERMEYNPANHSAKKIKLAEDALFSVGWLNNRLSFENTTMEDVAAELSRCYNVDIVFANERIKQHRFSGKISNNSLETVLRILSLTAPVEYTITDNTIELSESTK